MASGIKKRSGSDYSDGRPGRINYHSEDEYRTVTLTLQATAEDMHDITHLRDAVNELFDGELILREMRIKSVEVEYESMGQRTGGLQLEAPEYVNGKQIKVAMVNSPEIDDTALVSTFTVEFETTELPYFETIYTTLELHDSGYSATAEKYGLVDNIDDEKVKYRFEPSLSTINLSSSNFELGSISSGSGSNTSSDSEIRTKDYINVAPGHTYTFQDKINGDKVNYWWIFEYDNNGNYLGYFNTPIDGNGRTEFVAKGYRVRARSVSHSSLSPSDVGTETLPSITGYLEGVQTFTVYNAGNVSVEPESMYLNIFAAYVRSAGDFTIRNNTTGDEFILRRVSNGSHVRLNRMVVSMGSFTNIFRDTNKRFISLAPGDNQFEVLNGTFDRLDIDFNYYYK